MPAAKNQKESAECKKSMFGRLLLGPVSININIS
jgi:hypothetical protein